ncbi:MAG: PEGA domain-containing protein [Sandaracinaceae bacterium]
MFLLAFAAGPARAQDGRGEAEARTHFQRGVDLFDEGRLLEALSEFEEAHRLSANARILFNIGQLHAELGRSVEAVDALERFLREATDVDAEVRAEAQAALRTQRARIGRLVIELDAPQARVFVDDVERRAASREEPLRVSAGEHVVSVQAPGYEALRHRFRVAGGATYRAQLVLVQSGSRGASLRIGSRVPGVEVLVDGVSLGLTPLDATVPVSEGEHRIEGRRDGYAPHAQLVRVANGSEALVRIEARPDETAPPDSRAPLRIAIPRTSATLRVDGDEVDTHDTLTVPVGLHDIELRVADREPIAQRVDVPAGRGLSLTPEYAWTPEARAARIAGAGEQTVIGVVTLVAGATFVAAGVPVLAYDLAGLLPSLDERAADAQVCADPIGGEIECRGRLTMRGYAGDSDQFVAEYNRDQAAYYALLGTSIALTSVGAVGMILGAALVGLSPSEEQIDRAAGARLTPVIGPGYLGVAGAF